MSVNCAPKCFKQWGRPHTLHSNQSAQVSWTFGQPLVKKKKRYWCKLKRKMESEGQYYSAVRGSKQSILFLSFTRVSETENPSGPFTGGGSLLTLLLFLLFLFFFIHHNQKPGTFCKIKLIKTNNGLYSISSWRLLVSLYFWTFTKTKTKHHLVFRFTCTENCTFSLWPFSQFW